jgi:hypothetical protein
MLAMLASACNIQRGEITSQPSSTAQVGRTSIKIGDPRFFKRC